jgi:uncharacterized glyoxalase superfamily protein PhnB
MTASRPPLLTSALRYEDPVAAIAWLVRTLGFTEHFVARNGEGRVMHAQLRMGETMLFLGPDNPGDNYGMRSPRALQGSTQCICIALDNAGAVDAHFVRARAAGAEMISAPRDTEYGAHEYACRDPEGHVWSISDYRGEP